MPDLSVAVDHHDITVSKPGLGLSITYRRQGRILEATELMRNDPSGDQVLVGTILQSKLASGCNSGNLLAAHPNGRSRLTADYTVCSGSMA
jgi:hypothetical protein